jgi:hypothetical protein
MLLASRRAPCTWRNSADICSSVTGLFAFCGQVGAGRSCDSCGCCVLDAAGFSGERLMWLRRSMERGCALTVVLLVGVDEPGLDAIGQGLHNIDWGLAQLDGLEAFLWACQ